jgi:predicted O-methyltransferase YrrM
VFSSAQLAKKYLQYYFSASNRRGHGMHSPFVFDFILNVLQNKNAYSLPPDIEMLRRRLLADRRKIMVEDLGAGSRTNLSKERTVRQIARASLKSKKLAAVLFRLARHYQPATIIELGTSFGLTTSYFSKANPAAQITTIEGSASVAAIARENFERLHAGNIQLVQGNFDDRLPPLIQRLSAIDLAYIDGNHRYQPTIKYFRQLLSKSQNNTILVFDDIHWSAEMEKAWEEIKAHPAVMYTIDIFFLGFVFFRQEFKVKQHFSIRF